MLRSLRLANFTVFGEAELEFAPGLNVIVGENASGKSHLMKAAYAVLSASAQEGRRQNGAAPAKEALERGLAERLVGVFRPGRLGRLTQRSRGRARSEVGSEFVDRRLNLALSFATNSSAAVTLDVAPEAFLEQPPVFLPTRELITIYPGFVPLYEGRYVEFEETWRDACLLLGRPALRGQRAHDIAELVAPLEDAMGGTVVLDQDGRFYLQGTGLGKVEMPLVSEGHRKLAMLARLVATGSLLNQGYLFWDEPDANLNPRLIKHVAQAIVAIYRAGVQVWVATHSLFLMRELDILIRRNELLPDVRFFGLHPSDEGTVVEQGDTVDEIGPIASLDESLEQSGRYLDLE